METLRERLPVESSHSLTVQLPEGLAACLKGGGRGEEFSVWEFHERFARRASIAPEMATRYAQHIGDVLGDTMPEEELGAMRDNPLPSTGSHRRACSQILTITDRSSGGPTS